MPPILVGLVLGSDEVRLVVGFGVVILSGAENYPRNCGVLIPAILEGGIELLENFDQGVLTIWNGRRHLVVN